MRLDHVIERVRTALEMLENAERYDSDPAYHKAEVRRAIVELDHGAALLATEIKR